MCVTGTATTNRTCCCNVAAGCWVCQMMELNEGPVFLLLNPFIDHSRKDLPVDVYETGTSVIRVTANHLGHAKAYVLMKTISTVAAAGQMGLRPSSAASSIWDGCNALAPVRLTASGVTKCWRCIVATVAIHTQLHSRPNNVQHLAWRDTCCTFHTLPAYVPHPSHMSHPVELHVLEGVAQTIFVKANYSMEVCKD